MFVEMSKNILSREAKILGNFSTRQIIFGGIGLAVALTIGFSDAVSGYDQDVKIYLSLGFALPFFLIGFVKLYGQPLEKILPVIVRDNILLPAKRYYKTEFREIPAEAINPEYDEDGNLLSGGPQPEPKQQPKQQKTITPSRHREYRGIK